MSKCERIAEYAKENGMMMFSVTEYKDGEKQTVCVNERGCTNVYSVAKAFTMAAVGFVYDEGKLRLDETVGEMFGDLPRGSDERWKNVTVHDLLRQRSGALIGKTDIDSTPTLFVESRDWLEVIFAIPIEGITGETYKYTDDNYYLLSRIVSLKTGKTVRDYLREKLFLPLGFGEVAWSECPQGYTNGGSSLYIRSEDSAKLGKLWLDKGMWDGHRIISEEWVDMAVENAYAFECRSKDRRGYYKTGANGQFLYFSYVDKEVIAFNTYMKSEERTVLVDEFFPDN